MNKLVAILIVSVLCACNSGAGRVNEQKTVALSERGSMPAEGLSIKPVSHASFVMQGSGLTIYNDPVGGADVWADFPEADVVLVSDIHGDHLDSVTLEAVVGEQTSLVVPQAVVARLSPKLASRALVMANGETREVGGMEISAVPMYNLREEAKDFHVKGRGNGYLLSLGGERIYISGDTEDIAEMRELKGIDRAFVCMNLPYTMPVEAAADAVIEFGPRVVYPYHYRGKGGLSDTARFRELVEASSKSIEVVGLNWYGDR